MLLQPVFGPWAVPLRSLPVLVLALGVPAVSGPGAASLGALDDPESAAGAVAPAHFRFDTGTDAPALLIPRAERLEYEVYLEFGILSSHVGTVVQTCAVATQPPSVLMTSSAPASAEAASITLHASGSYLFYSLESTLETRILPQDWPRIRAQSVSTSSQTRRREVLLGEKSGQRVASTRLETTRGAPRGTRIWQAAKERGIPEGTLDMLLAVFQARALIREEKSELVFPLIDTEKLWRLRLRRGEERRIELARGTRFDVVEIVLEPEPYPGETFQQKPRFEGVFGIQGSLDHWVEKHTGIAIRIHGILPIGGGDAPIRLGVDVVLDSFSGTPLEFAPLAESED